MRTIAALILLGMAVSALAHNGEYHTPLPPPTIRETPKPGREGVTTRDQDRGTVTPGRAKSDPNKPLSTPPPRAPHDGPGFIRDDARFSVKLWWEANRYRFLPEAPTLPMKEELIAVLLDAADAESHTVKDRALIALGRAGCTQAFHRIEKVCSKKGEEPRVSSMLALGFLGEETASPILKKIVADGTAGATCRTFATLAIGMIGSRADLPFLREVLNEEWEPNIRSAAAVGLGLMADRQSDNAIGRLLLGAHPVESPDLARFGDTTSRAGLCAASAWALGRILTPRSYDYLIWALKSDDPAMATPAAIALTRAPGTVGLPALRRAMRHGTPVSVRQHILLGLAERRDPKAIEIAIRILTSDAERAGLLGPFAALSLGLTRDPAHGERLLALAGDKEETVDLRAAAVLGLGLSGNAKARTGLHRIVSADRAPDIVGRGVIALSMLKSPHALPLAKRILTESTLAEPRRNAVIALYILAPPDVEELLVEELTDSYHVNRVAALALARIAPRRAAKELTSRLTDPNLFARRFAAHSLGMLLARHRPGPLTKLIGGASLTSGAPVFKGCLYLENEYLYGLVRNY